MSIALLVPVVLLYYNSGLETGQCIVSNCKDSLSGSDETILTKLEEHDQRLHAMDQKMSSTIQEIKQSSVNAMEALQTTYGNLSSAIDQLNEKLNIVVNRLNGNIQRVMYQGEIILRKIEVHDQSLQVMGQNFSSAIDLLNGEMNAVLDRRNGSIQYIASGVQCESTSEVCDCSDISAMGFRASGMHRLYVVHQQKRRYFFAYCDMANGSWTVFQRRKDGSENFYRGWRDYENGFGNPNEEFWLGNEFLHFLTSKRSYRLRIEREYFEYRKFSSEYSTFSIGSSADKYRLTVRGYTGDNYGDSFTGSSNGRQFTTKDADNDIWSDGNCAVKRHGAWWYDHECCDSNLNGLYVHGYINNWPNCTALNGTGMWWDHHCSISKATEMKIS